MSNYVDKLMTNNVINTDSDELEYLYSENNSFKTGGKPIRPNNTPSGGFPPIFILEKPKEEIKETSKKRFINISENNSNLSIKDILSKKL